MWLSVGQSVDGVGLGVGPRGQGPASLLIYGSHCSLSYSSGGSRGARPTSATQRCLVALLTLDGAEGNM